MNMQLLRVLKTITNTIKQRSTNNKKYKIYKSLSICMQVKDSVMNHERGPDIAGWSYTAGIKSLPHYELFEIKCQMSASQD